MVPIESFEEMQQRLLDEFNGFDDVFSQYTYLIDFAAKLPSMSQEDRARSVKIEKCQSDAWVRVEKSSEDAYSVFGESDTLIVRGVLYLMCLLYSGRTAEEIASARMDFLQQTDLAYAFSDERITGFAAFEETIKNRVKALSGAA